MASDERLVEAVRAGRVDAFELIFDRYQRQILSFCRHMLGSREEAEDAVQQTFISAYRNLEGSDKPIQLRPWLYTIARNQCLSILRARRPQTTLDDVEPSVEGLAAAVQRREDLRAVLRDLSRLPDDQRAALLLSELGALSHDEISDVVGCPTGKVKALVFQARSSLAAGREARDMSCDEIREQLATLTGGALRRAHLRRHLDECLGCRQYQAEVKRQRKAMAIILPVAPTAALKSGLMSALAVKAGAAGIAAGAGASGAATTGGVGAVLAKVGATQLIVAGSLAAVGAGGTVVAIEASHHAKPATQSPSGESRSSGTGSAGTGDGTANSSGAGTGSSQAPSGVTPTRAHGDQALGKRTGGVANGQSVVTANGHSGTAPGQTGTSPGLAGTSPGKSKDAPGHTKAKVPGSSNGHSKGSDGGKGNGNANGHTKTKAPKEKGGSGGGGGGSDGQSTSGQGGSGGSSGTQGNSGNSGAGGSSGASHDQGKSNGGQRKGRSEDD